MRPEFKIRSDIVGETGEVPPETGVYISAEDPYASLQFAWAGNNGCRLRFANSFNSLGLDALRYVGRASLWVDEAKMYEFATKSHHASELRPQLEVSGTIYPSFAPSVIALAAFEKKKSTWYLVEQEDGPSVPSNLNWEDAQQSEETVRLIGGEVCVRSGYYYSPSRQHSRRYIAAGETAPTFDSAYGTTIWQLIPKN